MKVLIIEDDKSLLMAIEYRLRKESYEVISRTDGISGLECALGAEYDLMILDRMLPGMDGVTLLYKIRSGGNKLPVLILTAMDGINDRVAGLDAGADDYLVKPFAMDELMARVRALSRRQSGWSAGDRLSVCDLTLDIEGLTLACGENSALLSRREAKLLEILLRNQGQVLPRNLLLDRVWSDNIVEDGNLDIYIHFLRRRLAELGSKAKILTVRGVGYQLG